MRRRIIGWSLLVRSESPFNGELPRHDEGAEIALTLDRRALTNLVSRNPALALVDAAEEGGIRFSDHQYASQRHHATGIRARVRAGQWQITVSAGLQATPQ